MHACGEFKLKITNKLNGHSKEISSFFYGTTEIDQ